MSAPAASPLAAIPSRDLDALATALARLLAAAYRATQQDRPASAPPVATPPRRRPRAA